MKAVVVRIENLITTIPARLDFNTWLRVDD
jgi:hypothetical protein